MPDYRWSCQSCNESNMAESNSCQFCGCPAAANGETLEKWKVPDRKKPELPSSSPVWGLSIYSDRKTENCLSCKMHMYLSDSECPHCGFVQNPDHRHAFFESYERKKSSAMWQGAFFTIILISLLTMLFYWLDLPAS